MIDFYTASTPNGHKVSILLEECGFEYNIHTIDIKAGSQHNPEYRSINPNEKIPAIVDQEGPQGKPVRVFEAGAILHYLSDKAGRFGGNDPTTTLECSQWLSLITTGLAPAFVQVYYWSEKIPNESTEDISAFGRKRYHDEMVRLIGVLDFRLREYEYLAKTYTIADMAAYPWIDRHDYFGFSLDEFVGVRNWYNRLSRRAAIKRGIKIPS
tara:strand:+ start:902 stop:1534 length:633 start_codon:yes stop_codon:yes gene_type:complete